MNSRGLIAVLLLLLSTPLIAAENPSAKAPAQPSSQTLKASFAGDPAAADPTHDPTHDQTQTAATVLTLDVVVREVLENNPAVQSAAHMVAAQRRKISQARALSDPQVSVGWMGNALLSVCSRAIPPAIAASARCRCCPIPAS